MAKEFKCGDWVYPRLLLKTNYKKDGRTWLHKTSDKSYQDGQRITDFLVHHDINPGRVTDAVGKIVGIQDFEAWSKELCGYRNVINTLNDLEAHCDDRRAPSLIDVENEILADLASLKISKMNSNSTDRDTYKAKTQFMRSISDSVININVPSSESEHMLSSRQRRALVTASPPSEPELAEVGEHAHEVNPLYYRTPQERMRHLSTVNEYSNYTVSEAESREEYEHERQYIKRRDAMKIMELTGVDSEND